MALRINIEGNIEAVTLIDHNKAYNKNLPNQHSIDSITSLRFTLTTMDTTIGENTDNITTLLEDVEGISISVEELLNNQVSRVNLFEDLALITAPHDTMMVLVIEQGKIYRYKTSTGTWVPLTSSGGSGGGGGGGVLPTYEIFTATAGQKLITMQSAYIIGGNVLEVYINGALQKSDQMDSYGSSYTDYDYIEKSTTSIEFINPLEAGDLVVVKSSVGSIAIPVTTTTIEYEDCEYRIGDKRQKRRTITGDIENVTEFTYDNLDRVITESVTTGGVTKTKTIAYENVADGDLITSIVDQGTDVLTIHRLTNANRRVFEITNQSQLICNHAMNSKYLNVTVWVNNLVYNNYTSIEAIDNNNIKITTASPITGVIVVS